MMWNQVDELGHALRVVCMLVLNGCILHCIASAFSIGLVERKWFVIS